MMQMLRDAELPPRGVPHSQLHDDRDRLLHGLRAVFGITQRLQTPQNTGGRRMNPSIYE
jgi:hypothetical protein